MAISIKTPDDIQNARGRPPAAEVLEIIEPHVKLA